MKIKKTINLHEPVFCGNEYKYLNKCIKTSFVSSIGNYVKKFELKIKKFTKSKYVTNTINGTAALHLALKISNIKKKTEIIVPSITFIAPINTVIYNDCYPVFIDSDQYFNIDIKKILRFIKEETIFKNNKTYNKTSGSIISAIIVVHVFGNAVELDYLYKVCKKQNIILIEDASEALGTFYIKGKFKGKHVGTIGDVGCLSFNGNKIITSGGGGAILTNNYIFYKKAEYYSNQAKDDSLFFIHNEVGHNYKMSNLNAAVGLAQLEKIKTVLSKKKFVRGLYVDLFKDYEDIYLLANPIYSKNNNWLNIMRINNCKVESLQKLIKLFILNGINVRPVWRPNHLQKPFKKFQNYRINNANKLVKSSICLPSSSFITIKEINKIKKILDKWRK